MIWKYTCPKHGKLAGDALFCPICGSPRRKSLKVETIAITVLSLALVVSIMVGMRAFKEADENRLVAEASLKKAEAPDAQVKALLKKQVAQPAKLANEDASKEHVDNTKPEPVSIKDLPRDGLYHIVTGVELLRFDRKLRGANMSGKGELIRIDVFLVQMGPPAGSWYHNYSEFETSDRKFRFEALFPNWDSVTRSEIVTLGADKTFSKFRLYGRWLGRLNNPYLSVEKWHAMAEQPNSSEWVIIGSGGRGS